jgi:prepilin-type N-terminal cleavage/methylation domain-containing protein
VTLSFVRERFLKDERGFTLSEMVVTVIIMSVVLMALFSIFDMSVKTFSYGNNKIEAVQSARLGMETMEREIRAAYPVGSDGRLFFSANGSATSNPPQAMPSLTQITFGNELGAEGAGDGIIDCPNANDCEYITYKLTDDAAGSTAWCTESPCDLRRVNTVAASAANEPGDPVVDNAVFPGGLDFTYLRSDGTTVDSATCTLDPPLSACEREIAKVRVSLEIMVAPGTKNSAKQRLTTEIDLRNR